MQELSNGNISGDCLDTEMKLFNAEYTEKVDLITRKLLNLELYSNTTTGVTASNTEHNKENIGITVDMDNADKSNAADPKSMMVRGKLWEVLVCGNGYQDKEILLDTDVDFDALVTLNGDSSKEKVCENEFQSMKDDLEVMDMDIRRLLIYDIYQNGKECHEIKVLLYNYCFLNKKRYKQGMHELCGVIYKHLDESLKTSGSGGLMKDKERLTRIYKVFNNFMKIHIFTFDEVELLNFKNFQFEPLLQACFPSLYKCIEQKHKMNNMLWLLRWLRLLFLREFEKMTEPLLIWDFAFLQMSTNSSTSDMMSTRNKTEKYEKFLSILIMIFLVYESKEIICHCQDQSDLIQLFFKFFDFEPTSTNNTSVDHSKFSVPQLMRILQKTNEILNFDNQKSVVDIRSAIEQLIMTDSHKDNTLDKEWFKMFFQISDYNRLKLQQRLKDRVKSSIT